MTTIAQEPVRLRPNKSIVGVYLAFLALGTSLLLALELMVDRLPTNLVWAAVLLAWAVGLAVLKLEWGILATLTIMVFTGFLNRVSFHVSDVDFQYLFAFPELATTACLAILAVRFLAFRQQTVRSYRTLDLWILLYFLVLILQIVNPRGSPIVGLYGARLELIPIFMYFLSRVYFRKREDIVRFYKLVIVLGNAIAAYGIYQHLVGLPDFEFTWIELTPDIFSQIEASINSQTGWFIDGRLRVFSFLNGGQEFHFLLVLFFVLVFVYQPLRPVERLWQWARACFLLLTLLFLAVTLERTPILMIMIGLFAAYTIRGTFLNKRTFRLLVTTGLLGLLVFTGLNVMQARLLALVGGNQVLLRLVEAASPFSAESVESGRFQHWETSFQLIRANPGGYGLGSTLANRSTQGEVIAAPHNYYLRMAVEVGIPGLVVVLLVYAQILRQIIGHIQKVPPEAGILLRAILGVVLAFLACALFNNPLQTAVGFYFWFLIGLIPLVIGSSIEWDGEPSRPITTALGER
jgi:O-antigen ligase